MREQQSEQETVQASQFGSGDGFGVRPGEGGWIFPVEQPKQQELQQGDIQDDTGKQTTS